MITNPAQVADRQALDAVIQNMQHEPKDIDKDLLKVRSQSVHVQKNYAYTCIRICFWEAQGKARKSMKHGPEEDQDQDLEKGGRGRGRGRGRGKGRGKGRGQAVCPPKECRQDQRTSCPPNVDHVERNVKRNLLPEFEGAASAADVADSPATPAPRSTEPQSRKRSGEKIENPGKTRKQVQEENPGKTRKQVQEPVRKRKRSGGETTECEARSPIMDCTNTVEVRSLEV